MFVTALCPTFRHPTLLANSLALWNAQTYPAHLRRLVILDDGQTFDDDVGDTWELHGARERLPSLPAKYNLLLSLAPPETEAFLVWEDDDVYLPDYVAAHAACLERHELSHPSAVWSDYPGYLIEEPAAGRFHSALGFRRELIERIGGWPATDRADFDQQLQAALHAAAASKGDPFEGTGNRAQGTGHRDQGTGNREQGTGNRAQGTGHREQGTGNREEEPVLSVPCALSPMPYVYRWHTGHAHCQSTMRDPADETWYARGAEAYAEVPHVGRLTPEFDAGTLRILSEVQAGSLDLNPEP